MYYRIFEEWWKAHVKEWPVNDCDTSKGLAKAAWVASIKVIEEPLCTKCGRKVDDWEVKDSVSRKE
jgi:hypothetical protein